MASSGSRTIMETTIRSSSGAVRSTPIGRSSVVINRTIPGSTGYSQTIERSSRANVYQAGRALPDYAMMTATGVSTVKESRDQEKRDMQDLNERFANYIDKVRYLEAQNRKLADDLDKLKTRWGKDTAQIKAMFQAELDEARRALDDAEREKARLEIRVASLEDQIEEIRIELTDYAQLAGDYRERIARNNQLLIEYENEIQLLRKRIDQLETESEKDRKLIETLTESLAKTREELDNETLLHIDAENRRQTLEEEIEFLKQIHEQEMKELSALIYQGSSSENRDFWKNEMAQAIREIQQMYDDKMDQMRLDLEASYKVKVDQFQQGATKTNVEATKAKDDSSKARQELADLRDRLNQLQNDLLRNQKEYELLLREKESRERELELTNADLQGQAARLKAELDSILKQLQAVMNSKMGLELEIAAYRKLLEGEENRLSLKSMVDSMSAGGGFSSSSSRGGGSADIGSMAKGEISAKTTYQKSAKGPIAICECPPDGKFIQIENTGTRDENLVGWKLVRSVDGRDVTPYDFDSRFSSVRRGQKITLWARNQKPRGASQFDIEVNIDNWGIGQTANTRLINKEGEERASNIQRTSYVS